MAATDATVQQLRVPVAETRRVSAGLWSDAVWRLRHDPTTLVAMAVLVVFVTLALGADFLATSFFHRAFSQQDILSSYEKPSLAEPWQWLGTDELGRSQAVRLLYGARVSLFVGGFGALTALVIGLTAGVTAGYFRGWWDDVVVWLVTTLNSIPRLYLLLIVGILWRLEPFPFAMFLGLLGWLGICNYARGQTISLREREYVLAARTVGCTPLRLMVRHIVPNILPLIIVLGMIEIGQLILTESAISFIGFGIQPPTPSWGNMLTNAAQYLSKAPHLIFPPGLAVVVTVLCLYLVGDGLRDALDPRLRGAIGTRR
ncbi:MAG: ABC transporter permease [Chloroflexi bacterium]|nr:MAG: ABC transporter permease [Chloroflexota bacterium]TMC28880.1 MAG: ABC transporter permease [Chloroflexota bacterium]TMC33823.1 MAG: ABC transporter permease [Chloroflexota bacterium]TMC55949.1 MAG: ABC transporter permease [Chloroflexota bacterium]TME43241.1 MAG: ABC transporter permease [Chloroflexota bacterium]